MLPVRVPQEAGFKPLVSSYWKIQTKDRDMDIGRQIIAKNNRKILRARNAVADDLINISNRLYGISHDRYLTDFEKIDVAAANTRLETVIARLKLIRELPT